MKKIIGISVLALLAAFSSANAQDTTKKDTTAPDTTKKVTTKVKEGAVSAGNKTAEVASKGKSTVTDKVYKGKEGPNGETIYIDKNSNYYWIDKKGHKVPISKNELRSKE